MAAHRESFNQGQGFRFHFHRDGHFWETSFDSEVPDVDFGPQSTEEEDNEAREKERQEEKSRKLWQERERQEKERQEQNRKEQQQREEQKRKEEEAAAKAKEERSKAEKLRQQKIWEDCGATTTVQKQKACEHTDTWPKVQSKKKGEKVKCDSCGKRRGTIAFKCPHCDLVACQVCLSNFAKKRAKAGLSAKSKS